MPRFYFSIVAGDQVIPDLDGTELAAIEDARAWAIADARGLMSDAILLGQDLSQRAMRISDEAGNIVLVVQFSEAISPE